MSTISDYGSEESAEPELETAVTESQPQTPAFPFILLIAVAGAVILIASVVVFLVRWKRQR